MKNICSAALMAATILSPLTITAAEAASVAPQSTSSAVIAPAKLQREGRAQADRRGNVGQRSGMRGNWNSPDGRSSRVRQSPNTTPRRTKPAEQAMSGAQFRAQRAEAARAAQANRTERRAESRQDNRELRGEYRRERRSDSRDTRTQRRTENRGTRQDRRGDNRDYRQDRRADTRDNRQDRQRDNRNYRRDQRSDTREYRRDRQEYRRDRRTDNRNWQRTWRSDRRYDWRNYRRSNRSVYRPRHAYYAPFRGYNYRRLSIGFYLGSAFYGSNYWINDPWYYRLPPAYGPYRWVRYYDDVVLVNSYTGEVVDVIHDFFW